jgi:uncharacterized protein (DUF433 family)
VAISKQRQIMDWTHCPEIERIAGRVGGRPVIRGTRIEPDTIVTDFELGSPVEEIHENFPTVTLDTIKKVIAFAH